MWRSSVKGALYFILTGLLGTYQGLLVVQKLVDSLHCPEPCNGVSSNVTPTRPWCPETREGRYELLGSSIDGIHGCGQNEASEERELSGSLLTELSSG